MLADQLFTLHNQVRTNPQSFITILEKYKTYFKENILNKPSGPIETIEGPLAYEEAIKFLKNQMSSPALKLHTILSNIAEKHCYDVGKGIYDHIGSDGKDPAQRIEQYIEWDIKCAESIEIGSNSAEEIMINLIVDDGVHSRGHRSNIFSNDFKYIGIACGLHSIHEICTVINYVAEIKEEKIYNKMIIENTYIYN